MECSGLGLTPAGGPCLLAFCHLSPCWVSDDQTGMLVPGPTSPQSAACLGLGVPVTIGPVVRDEPEQPASVQPSCLA